MNALSPAAGWTDERVALLKQHYVDGLSCSKSAAILRVTSGAISGKRRRLGLCAPMPVKAGAPQVARRMKESTVPKSTKAKPIPAATQVKLAARPASALGLSLSHPNFAGCRWPIAGERDETLFCCAARRPGRVYCDEHHAIAFNPKPLPKLRAA